MCSFSCTVGFAILTVAFFLLLFVVKKGHCGLMCLVDSSVLFDGSKGGVCISLSIFVRLDADLMYDPIDFSTSILLIRCTCAAKPNTSVSTCHFNESI